MKLWQECDERAHIEDSLRNGDCEMIHANGSTVFVNETAWTVRSSWPDPVGRGDAYRTYDLIRHKGEQTLFALHLHGELDSVCPFCAFFEQDARPVGTGKVGDIAACDVCSDGPDISEMLLDWYEEYIK
jgi:hypothetical protein